MGKSSKNSIDRYSINRERPSEFKQKDSLFHKNRNTEDEDEEKKLVLSTFISMGRVYHNDNTYNNSDELFKRMMSENNSKKES
jgi:hypothetical protein